VNLDVTAVCSALIGIDTQNPPGNEAILGAYVAELLTAHGFDIEWIGQDPLRANLIATLCRGPGPRVILQAHADTKPATAVGGTNLWNTDPFAAAIDGDRLYGVGACDTKGAMAVFLCAATTLAARSDWSGTLIVQCVADEEDGSVWGAQLLAEHGLLTADAAIVGEPTGCRPSLAQLGLAWAEVTITGRTTHAGTPLQGADAFRAATSYIDALDELVAKLPTDPDFPGHPRVNVGYMQIPGHPGTVAGECVLRADIRVLPSQDRDHIAELYRTAAASLSSDKVRIAVAAYQGGGCHSHFIGTDTDLARAFAHAQRETGQQVATEQFLGGSDARFFGPAGTPAVVFGPGSLRHAHSPNEFVPIAELVLATGQVGVVLEQIFQISSLPPM
jgi:acetylornithine deacetylase/succinyl-diaminopimelate desuccinylase-like protein